MVQNADADRFKLGRRAAAVSGGSPTGDPAGVSVSNVLGGQTDRLHGVLVGCSGEDVFAEFEKADVVVHSRAVVGGVVVFGVDVDVVRLQGELIRRVVLVLVVFAELSGDRLDLN